MRLNQKALLRATHSCAKENDSDVVCQLYRTPKCICISKKSYGGSMNFSYDDYCLIHPKSIHVQLLNFLLGLLSLFDIDDGSCTVSS